MPASALLSSQPPEEQAMPGLDLLVVVPGGPGPMYDVVMAVVTAARGRGWRVRTVPLSDVALDRPTAPDAVCVHKPATRRG